jgi:UDP-3-O-[3-hydroxymyristoyl] glucosamine N-acyltransferase
MKLNELLKNIPHISCAGNTDIEISTVQSFDINNKLNSVLMWLNEKNSSLLHQLQSGVVICSSNVEYKNNPNTTLILCDNPRFTFAETVKILYKKEFSNFISPTAFIDKSSIISNEVRIGHHVVIEENCHIGKFVTIDHNTVIKAGTLIKDNVTIGANCTIGGVGFGYEKDTNGEYQQIHHIGYVEIGCHVEIGNNTCIDKGVLGATLIKNNAKIDNLVHIAHGVEIGENTLVIAHAMIGGSATIGNNVWVAPCASIINKASIAKDTLIGMGAVIIKSSEIVGDKLVGNPAKSILK